jgi:hypothetical protein
MVGTPPLLWGLSSRTSFAGTVFFVRLVDLCLLGKGITVCAKLLGMFPLLSSEEGSFYLQRQAAISLLRVCIVTYSGHGRETSILNYRSGCVLCPAAVPRVGRSKCFSSRSQSFISIGKKGIFFSGVAGDRFKNKAEVFSLHTPGGDALEVHRIWG